MLYSRDPERTPFQWDDSIDAGFSRAAKTWLPINANYLDVNVKNQKAADKSHFKFYQKLMKLRSHDTFLYGDLKVVALNRNVFAYVRELLDSDTFVVVVNLGPEDEHINLKAFATLCDKLKVVAASPASDYDEG